MKNTLIALLILIILGVGGWYLYTNKDTLFPSGDNGEEQKEDGIVALVNGEEVSQDDFNALQTQVASQQGIDVSSLTQEEKTNFETQVLNTLISQVLLRQAIGDSQTSVDDSQIDEQVENIKNRFETEAAFNEALSSQGATLGDLREQVRSQLTTQTYLNEQLDFESLSATDAEIQSTYEQAVAGQEDAPALSDVRGQVQQLVLQQKQQQLVNELIEELRADADIEVLL